jgi:hypothetical protein
MRLRHLQLIQLLVSFLLVGGALFLLFFLQTVIFLHFLPSIVSHFGLGCWAMAYLLSSFFVPLAVFHYYDKYLDHQISAWLSRKLMP